MNNLTKRIFTGILLASISGFCMFEGNETFVIFIAVLTSICVYELGKIYKLNHFLTILILITLNLIMYSTQHSCYSACWLSPIIMYASLGICLYSGIELFKKKILFQTQNQIINSIKISLLCGLTFPFAILIRNLPNGLELVLCIAVTIISVDSCAYFSGKILGKRPLTSISPKKTIEGSLSGTLCGILTSCSIFYVLNLPQYYILSIIIVIIAQLGDIHESLIKRHYHIKDSSKILPGHGGLYDRCDGYIFNFPILYYAIQFLGT